MGQKPNTGTLNSGEGGGGEGGGLTDEQKAEVEALVNGAVNGAITNHLSRFKKDMTESVTKTLGEALTPIGAQLKEVSEKLAGSAPQGGGEAPKGGGKKGEMPPEFSEELNKARGQVEELKAQVAKEKAARDEERAQAERAREEGLRREERDQLGQVLRARGVSEVQARAAVALLHGEEKVVGRSEDGSIVYKVSKGTGAAKYVDEIALDKGVEEWLKSEDGKSFLPARQVGGAGGLGARPGSTGDAKKDSKAQAAHDLAKALLGG